MSQHWPPPTWPTNRPDGRIATVDVIDYFDDFNGPNPYAFLSNFYAAPIEINGRSYPTNEHYYQAQKPDNSIQAMAIEQCRTPGHAKQLGQTCSLRADWEAIKVDVMLSALRAKFTQHTHLREKLLATGGDLLVEGNTWGDRIWGCVNGTGENLLGILLMLVRAELRLRPKSSKTTKTRAVETDLLDGSGGPGVCRCGEYETCAVCLSPNR